MDAKNDKQEFLKDQNINVEGQVQLVTRFFSDQSMQDLGTYQSMALDLYRAITCYRLYDSKDVFIAANPELMNCKQDIDELWREFDKLSSPELAEIAIKLLEDI